MTLTRAEIPVRWRGHRFLSEMLNQPLEVHSSDDAIVVEHSSRGGRGFIGVGKPPAIADLLHTVDPRPLSHGSVLRGTWEHLSSAYRDALGLREREDWDWMDIGFSPQFPHMDRVRELDPLTERNVIETVRQRAIPDSYLHIDTPGSRWYGWFDADGEIRGVGGATGWDGAGWRGGAHLGSIGTDPAHEGRGIGSALTAGIIRRAFEEGADRASLGVYAGNRRAIEVYRRLGFTTTYEITSLRLAR